MEMFATPPNEDSYLTLSHLSQILSHNAMFWPLSPELFDPIDEFDGNPSRLTVPTPSLTYDSSDDEDEYDWAKTPSPVMAAEDIILFQVDDHDQEAQPYCIGPGSPVNSVITCASAEDDGMDRTEWQEDEEQQCQRTRRTRRGRASKPRRYECHMCHATFNRSYNLKTHELTHNKKRVKRFGCPLCDKGFDRKHDQQRHIAAMHAGGASKLACYACDAHFRRKDALVKHLACDHS